MAQNEAWASGVSDVAGAVASADFGDGKRDPYDPKYQKTLSQAGRDYLNN